MSSSWLGRAVQRGHSLGVINGVPLPSRATCGAWPISMAWLVSGVGRTWMVVITGIASYRSSCGMDDDHGGVLIPWGYDSLASGAQNE